MRTQGDRGILNESGSGYLPITQASLDAVKPFACRTLDDAGQQALAQAHRELLQAATEQPAGVEVALCYGLDMQPLGEIIPGDKPGQVRIPDQNIPYIAAHTHPSGLTFSTGDIRNFAKRQRLQMLTAVGNNGRVYAVEKTEKFDSFGTLERLDTVEKELSQAKSAQEAQTIMERFLKGAGANGIQYYA